MRCRFIADGVLNWSKQLTRTVTGSISPSRFSPFLCFYISISTVFCCLSHCFVFCSSQTDGSVPNTLVIANCEVVKPRVAAAEHISQVISIAVVIPFAFRFHFFPIYLFLVVFQFNEESRSPFVKKFKTILHPGEVCFLLAHGSHTFCLGIVSPFRRIYALINALLPLRLSHLQSLF